MAEPNEGVDWTGVSEEMARQIFAQGETFMQAQLQAALAADSRATAMAGIFVTLSLAVLGGSFAYWDSKDSLPILAAGVVAGTLLLASAVAAAWAARPIDFYFPGNQPHQWFPGRMNNLVGMIGGEAENYDARIVFNQERLGENQTAIKVAFWLALAAPLLASTAWIVTMATCSSCRV